MILLVPAMWIYPVINWDSDKIAIIIIIIVEKITIIDPDLTKCSIGI